MPRSPEGVIDLGIGQPDMRILPLAEVLDVSQSRLTKSGAAYLQYGPGCGHPRFRGALAGYLTRTYGVEVLADHLMTTFGASHGLDLILSAYAAPGDAVLVEEHTYFHALKIFSGRGVEVIPVPMDQDGLVPDALPALIERHAPRLLYTIPVHHNPTGRTLTRSRRERLAEVLEAHDLLVVADEVYQLLTYDGAPPPPLRTYDPERVISLSSFSKLLAPGLRFGWIEASEAIIARLARCGVLTSGGGATPLVAALLHEAIESGVLDGYVDRLRGVYPARRAALVDALSEQGLSFEAPRGGFFVWVDLGRDAAALRPAARDAGVGFIPAQATHPQGAESPYARLCFTYYDESEIADAVRRLGGVIRDAT